jgi:UDPglucose 6-dehydrogenase
MRVTVIGTGYVGLVAGACLAEVGHEVVCADVSTEKVTRLQRGESTIHEPGLEPLLQRNLANGRLAFTTDLERAVRHGVVVLIAVGTPSGEDGSADVSRVLDVARTIGRHMDGPRVVVTKSTVPVGTTERVGEVVRAETRHAVEVCAGPEFLREGSAVADFLRPDRLVLGVGSAHAREVLTRLYAPFARDGEALHFMDVRSAEVTKYAANAMLAARIAFMNEVAALCDAAGADVDPVRRALGADPRIGPAFLVPGPGYGGSCLPKDTRALVRTAREHGHEPRLWAAIVEANEQHRRGPFLRLQRALGAALRGATVAVLGLAFKAGTDDVRESAALDLVEDLLAAGAVVRVHDPAAMAAAREQLGTRVAYARDAYEAAAGARGLLVMTEWPEYRALDLARLATTLERPLLVDARNLYEPAHARAAGLEHLPLGRPRG